MSEDRLARNDVINLAGALWNILRREYSTDLRGVESGQSRSFSQHGPVDNLEKLSNAEVDRVAWNVLHSLVRPDEVAQKLQMTIASFVENKFVPEHVALKSPSGRAHYKAMLKHVLKPEEVDQMLSVRRKKSDRALKMVPGWPYLSDVRLCDIGPGHVSMLTSAAAARGYSPNTVMHLRNVVSAIFSHAKREQYFIGDNPVSLVKPQIRRKSTPALTLAQAQKAISVMKYPEKEMTLIAAFSGMNLAEILGLQWKHVNLTQFETSYSGNVIPPWTIAVREQLYRGRLIRVKKNRVRNLPIPTPLLQVLINLKSRERFVGFNDFVLVSQVGTPINQNNILARRLRPIARQLGVPSLSCQAFRRIRKILASDLGNQFQVFATNAAPSAPLYVEGELRSWHCRAQRQQI